MGDIQYQYMIGGISMMRGMGGHIMGRFLA